jgi:hypothetical protein
MAGCSGCGANRKYQTTPVDLICEHFEYCPANQRAGLPLMKSTHSLVTHKLHGSRVTPIRNANVASNVRLALEKRAVELIRFALKNLVD